MSEQSKIEHKIPSPAEATYYGYTKQREFQESFEEAPLWAAFITYLGYFILNIFGMFRDFLRQVGIEEKKGAKDSNPSVNT
jgi:hypothetical protein